MNGITIQNIKISELETFINSEDFNQQSVIPISTKRAHSFINNPRAKPEDTALVLAYENAILIGYRTLLSDSFISKNEEIRFAWFSGVWVSKKHRRKGVGTMLFNEAYASWNGNLMYSNYAPNAKKLFDKTNKFELLSVKHGFRYYTRFCLKPLLEHRLGGLKFISPLLGWIDTFLNVFIDQRNFVADDTNAQIRSASDLQKNKINNLGNIDSLFGRGEKEFGWFFKYPWLSSSPMDIEESSKYYFSFYKKYSEQVVCRIEGENDIPESSCLLTLVNDHLNVHYVNARANNCIEVLNRIIAYSKKNKVSYVDCFDENLNRNMYKRKRFSLFCKQRSLHFYCSSKLLTNHPEIKNKFVYSGDGDLLFT